MRHTLDTPYLNRFGNPAIVNPVGYEVGYPIQRMVSSKSRVAFVPFGLFSDVFGIHNFYAG
jgi:hypothetical protein